MDNNTNLSNEILEKRAELYAQEGMKTFDALELVAGELGLTLIYEDPACRIYRTSDGNLINCWVG